MHKDYHDGAHQGHGGGAAPRVAIVDPVGAQVLETVVDGDGRVIRIDLLDGGSGFDDVPSVYIVDNRTNGGTGATAVASIFNGQITDINISAFGSGYSAANPPEIVIQSPPQAKASADIGLNQVTGFNVTEVGSGYTKHSLLDVLELHQVLLHTRKMVTQYSVIILLLQQHAVGASVKCLDALFVKEIIRQVYTTVLT